MNNPSDSSPEKPAGELPAPRTTRLVIGVGLGLVVIFTLLAISILQNVPDQRRLMTPAPVTGTPTFAAEVEARVAAADASRGEPLFTRYACVSCHRPEGFSTGPNLTGMGQRAAARREGYSAAAYLYEAIVNPNAFTVPDYPAGVMLQSYGDAIPDDELYDLIAWLLLH
jgi:mono/diheme cytochrome c family protein